MKVRIDQMTDGSFRYASWKNKDISANHDVVISNGKCISAQIDKSICAEEVKFIFKNYSFEYIVTYEIIQYNRFNAINPTRLCVYQNGKKLIDIVPTGNLKYQMLISPTTLYICNRKIPLPHIQS